MQECTVGAIALGPSGNLQVDVLFFSLDPGCVLNRTKTDSTLLPMSADVNKRVNCMTQKSRPGLLFADCHNVCVNVSLITPETNPDSDIPVATPVMVGVSSDDDYTDDDYNLDADDDAFSDSSINDSIVFDADFPNHNVDDEITGVDQTQNDNDILFPMHVDPNIDKVPAVDIPGMEDEAYEAVDDGTPGEFPGVHDISDNDSDSDSDDDEQHPIRTRSGQTVHSTQNPDYVYTIIGADTSFLQ